MDPGRIIEEKFFECQQFETFATPTLYFRSTRTVAWKMIFVFYSFFLLSSAPISPFPSWASVESSGKKKVVKQNDFATFPGINLLAAAAALSKLVLERKDSAMSYW